MFEELYTPLPDAEQYLQRIRYDGPVRGDRETLDALVRAHLISVPFENIDIYDRRLPIDLGIPALFDKIVTRRRGGYCFELNGLFMSLLTELGFTCHAVAARVLGDKNYTPPLSHRATVVTIGGERYYCDVGFGGAMAPCSLAFDDPGLQATERGLFRFAPGGGQTTALILKTSKGEVPLLSVADRPMDPVDFIPLNFYTSTFPGSLFQNHRMAHLLSEGGRVSLEGNELRRTGEPPITLASREEIAGALSKEFGITVDREDLRTE
jgi:N-hydroxyarylamine O-acetyltransferase